MLQHHRPVLIESQGIWQLKWQISGAAVLDARACGRGVYGAALPKSPPVPFAQAFGKDSAALSKLVPYWKFPKFIIMNILFSIWTCLQPGVLGFEGVWVSGMSMHIKSEGQQWHNWQGVECPQETSDREISANLSEKDREGKTEIVEKKKENWKSEG